MYVYITSSAAVNKKKHICHSMQLKIKNQTKSKIYFFFKYYKKRKINY